MSKKYLNILISDTSYSIQLLRWHFTNGIWGLITVSWSSENWAYNDETVNSPFYIYPKRNIILECIPINFDFTVHSQFKNLCPKCTKSFIFIKKIYYTKIDIGEQNRCNTVPAEWNLDLNRRTFNDKTFSANWLVGDMYVPIELYRFEL